jgi:hypothetical protein
MIIYSAPETSGDSPTGTAYFRSLVEARKWVRSAVQPGYPLMIVKNTIGKLDKERVVAMLNCTAWCAYAEDVEEWENQTCKQRDVARPCKTCRDGYGACMKPVLKKIYEA